MRSFAIALSLVVVLFVQLAYGELKERKLTDPQEVRDANCESGRIPFEQTNDAGQKRIDCRVDPKECKAGEVPNDVPDGPGDKRKCRPADERKQPVSFEN